MAYSVLLSSVSDDQVIAFRQGRRPTLEAGLSVSCSHLLTSWVRPDDLRNLLRQAIDGGERLRPDLHHPFRAPLWHSATSAAEIESKLRACYSEHSEKAGPIDPSDWYVLQITNVLTVFAHASACHNGVVSFVEQVAADERAKRISI